MPTAGELNAILDAIAQLGIPWAEGFNFQLTPAGFQLNPEPTNFLWIKITAQSGSTNAYSWSQVIETPGSPGTWVVPTDGLAGTYSDLVAKEANGNTTVPTNSICPAWFAADGLSLTFLYETFAGLSVQYDDASGTVSSVTTLRVSPKTAWIISTSGAGIAQITLDYAIPTEPGIVSTTTQGFGGVKTFLDGAAFSGHQSMSGQAYGWAYSIFSGSTATAVYALSTAISPVDGVDAPLTFISLNSNASSGEVKMATYTSDSPPKLVGYASLFGEDTLGYLSLGLNANIAGFPNALTFMNADYLFANNATVGGSGGGVSTKLTYLGIQGVTQASAPPASTDFDTANGTNFLVHKDSSTGKWYLAFYTGSSVKKVELT